MKVVISGATGFLGEEALRTFFDQGLEVTGLGRNTEKIASFKEQGISAECCDLSEKERLIKMCQGKEVFVHCAALSSAWGKYQDFYQANVVGTKNVIESCLNAGVKRLIHISTPSLYVEKADKSFIKEDDPLPGKKINHYATTKFLAEQLIWKAKDRLEVIVLRPQAIIGTGDRSIFPRILRLGKKGVLPVIGDGKNKIDMTCVENVVEAIKAALFAPTGATGEVYNITNDEPIELYSTLRSVFNELGFSFKERRLSFETAYNLGRVFETLYFPFPGKEPLLTRYSACVLGRERTLDISKAKQRLGYAPKLGIQEGLQNFLQGLKS